MGGISTGTGIFSGINTQELIGQLMAIESRPKILIQQRIAQLQTQQAAYLDINSRLGSLRDAAAAFRTGKTFQSKKAVSSDDGVLTAVASAGATPGTYQMIVDRLVSSQQLLSRGFASSSAALGAGDFTFESAAARLDRDTRLADLNGGEGVERGKIILAVEGGSSETIDLSRVGTMSEVIDAINANGLGITASASGNRLVLSHGTANITVKSANGYDTAASLGVERLTFTSHTVTGGELYRVGAETALRALNDGNGVFIGNTAGSAAFDFTVRVTDGATVTNVNVNLGGVYDAENKLVEGAVSTVGGVIERINDALTAAGVTDVAASVAGDGSGLQIVDSAGTKTLRIVDNENTVGNTALDLGLTPDTDSTGTITGERILAGINSTLARTLNGGAGIAGDGTISITDRTGTVHAVTIDTRAALSDVLAKFAADTGGAVTAALDAKGTGIVLTDTTAGTGNLVVSGQSAESLGIDTAGVASSTVASGNLQHQYMTVATRLDSLRNGAGIGTGDFIIKDSTGATALVSVKDTDETLGDVIRLINSRPTRVRAKINAEGDGIELYEEAAGAGTQKISVEDKSGGVAAALNLEGEAAATGAGNVIDGSFERIVKIDPADSLAKVVEKINSAGLGVAATIINDGAGSTPFRLSLTATGSGTTGRFLADTGALDMDLRTLDRGQDSRVFFGSTDPARAVLLSSSSNTLDSVISGVTIDLNGVSSDPVTLSVSRDSAGIEAAVSAFVDAFNAVTDRINQQTRYDPESKQKGPLLGDGTAISLRSALYGAVQGRAQGMEGRYETLADVGITVGQGGKLELDRDVLRQAMETDPQAVEDVFAARVLTPGYDEITLPGGGKAKDPNAKERFDKLGVAGLIEQMAKTYLDTVDGVLTGRNRAITDQIEAQNRRIDDLDVRLESRRQILERKFLAMETAIGQLQAQQGALGSIGQR
ncbi:MAG: flagellar filament capping protein FliD [Phycisphaerales bacterium]|nr:flagellar filament capping protein FliD [Phycisphaerales bacterium]